MTVTAVQSSLGKGKFRWMVGVLTTVQAVGTLTPLVIPAVGPAIAEGYAVPGYMIGYQASLLYVGMVVAMMAGTSLTLRWGGCRAMQFGLLLIAASSLAVTAGNLALLAIASIVMGVGYGLITPAGSHILLRFTPSGIRNLVFSIKQSGVPLGVVIAALAGPALTVNASWKLPLLVCAAICLGMALLLQTWHGLLDDDRDPGGPLLTNPVQAVKLVWTTPPLRLLACAATLLACSQVIQHSYTVTFFHAEMHLSLVEAGVMLMTAQIGGFFGRPLWGWIADRSGDCMTTLAVLVAILATCELATATLPLGWPRAFTYALFFLFGATASGWHGAFLAEVARLAPAGRAAVGTGGALVLTNTMSMIAPVVFASAYVALDSYALVFGLLALPTLGALALILKSRRMR